MTDKLTTLYYPFSRCTNEATLKRLILLYDEVWFVDPVPSRMRHGLMLNSYVPSEITNEWQIVQEKYALLEEKRAVRFIDPVPLITSHDTVLTASIESDVTDNALWQLLDDYDVPAEWSILKERVPASVFNLLRDSVAPGYIGHVKDQSRYARGEPGEQLHLVWDGWIPPHVAEWIPGREPTPPEMREAPWDLNARYTPQEIFDAFFRWIHSDSEVSFEIDYRGLPTDKRDWIFAIETSYLNGSSIALNEAMLVSDFLGSTMVTDSDVHHQMLVLKYKRAAENAVSGSGRIPALKKSIPADRRTRYEYVAFNVFQYLVSDEVLASMSLEQCLRYREASRDALQRLRSYLKEVDTEISANVWDEKIENQVQDLINKRIAPEALRASDELKSIRTKLFGNLSATLTTAAIPSLVVSIYPGLHPTMSLLFGASALTGGSMAVAIKETADAITASRSAKRNGLSYLLRAGR